MSLIRNTDIKDKIIELPKDSITITYKLAQIYGIKKGDIIKWHIYGDTNWVESEITEIDRHPSNQGMTLYKVNFEKLGFTYKPTSIVTLEPEIEYLDGISSIQNISEMKNGWDELMQSINLMIYILIIAAALLAIVVMYNLGVLSFTEIEREFATLKVLGMPTKKLFELLLTQTVFLSFIGFLIGIPVGKKIVDIITSLTGDAFDMLVIIRFTNVLLSFTIVMGLSILVNLLFYKKIKKVNMVESLKGVE
jgi:putative ABC transport system permease protein